MLANRRKILACEQDGVVKILGLKQVNLYSLEHVEDLIAQGMDSRKVGSSSANEQSSRSHAIMQFSSFRTGAKLLIVDLAGSERGADQLVHSTPTTRLEGAEINKSLLALKECIRAMDQDATHLPFRQSKLTQVLRDAFIGKGSLTTMIATISPTAGCSENTLNTLRYADRVKELKGEVSREVKENQAPTPVLEEAMEKTPSKRKNESSLLKLAITNHNNSSSHLSTPSISHLSTPSITTPIAQPVVAIKASPKSPRVIAPKPTAKVSARQKVGALLEELRALTDKCSEGEEGEVLELVQEELEALKAALLNSLRSS